VAALLKAADQRKSMSDMGGALVILDRLINFLRTYRHFNPSETDETLLTALASTGDYHTERGDATASLQAYEQCLAIARAMVAAAPQNITALFRVLLFSHLVLPHADSARAAELAKEMSELIKALEVHHFEVLATEDQRRWFLEIKTHHSKRATEQAQ
jgi:hypothetical protein